MCMIHWVCQLSLHVLIQDLALGHRPQDQRHRLQGTVGFPPCRCHWLVGGRSEGGSRDPSAPIQPKALYMLNSAVSERDPERDTAIQGPQQGQSLEPD